MTAEIRLTGLAHEFIATHVQEGDVAVDATVGNGHDTLFLAGRVGVAGLVYGFDIQPRALHAARARLRAVNQEARLRLLLAGHETMREHIEAPHQGRIAAAMFNLGYLPGGDKQVMTLATTTLTALDAALELLAPGGGLSILAYPGHPGGEAEYLAVARWLEAAHGGRLQSHERRTASVRSGGGAGAPVLFLVSKSDE